MAFVYQMETYVSLGLNREYYTDTWFAVSSEPYLP